MMMTQNATTALAATAAPNNVPTNAAAVPEGAAAAAAAAASSQSAASTSLYCGDLLPEVTEAMLYEIFSSVGPISSIRVCRDTVTRRSLGYAYVNYQSPTDADRALDGLNYTPVKGKPCRLMWSQRNPDVRRSHVGNVFIKNLERSIDNKQLYDTFCDFGNILSCKVVEDASGSKGYGFVHYETDEEAQLAIDTVNGKLLLGKKVYVGPFQARKDRIAAGEYQCKFNNVFVKNLPDDMTEESLTELFAKHGTLTSVKVMTDADGKSRGFGFVCFQDPEEARVAVEELNGHEVAEGKQLYVGRAQKKAEREAELRAKREQIKAERQSKYQGVNLYIKNLDDNVDDERLRKEFSTFGTVTSAKVMSDAKGVSKGFGFVCLSLPEEATKAVTEMNGRIIEKKPLYVGLAERRDVRRSKLEQQYMHSRQAGGVMMPGQGGLAGAMGPAGFMAGGRNMYGGGVGGMPGVGMRGAPRWGMPGAMVGAAGPRDAAAAGMMYGGAVGFQMPHGGAGMMRNGGGAPRGARGGPNSGGVPGQAMGGANRPGYNNNKFNQQQQAMRNGPAAASTAAASKPAPQAAAALGAAATAAAPAPAAAAKEGEAAVGFVRADGSIDAAALAVAPAKEQKQVLGDQLYPRVVGSVGAESAGKVTGMLLDMDVGELLHLVENEGALKAKVNEAMLVLRAHQQQQQTRTEEAPEM